MISHTYSISRQKIFSRFHWIPLYLCFPRARSKFGTDSPFYSGDIATFVPGGRVLETCETAIFLRDLRGEKFSVYALRYTSCVDTPPRSCSRGDRTTPLPVVTKKEGPTKVAGTFLASLVYLPPG